MKRFWRDTGGNAALEFALTAPMLALLATAAMDFTRAGYEQHRLSAAARAGTTYAIQGSSDWTASTGIIAAARADAGDTAAALSVTTSECSCPSSTSPCSTAASCTGSDVAGTYVKVSVSETYTTLVKYPFFARNFTILGQSLVRVQ